MQAIPETLYNEAKLLDKGIMPDPRMATLILTYNCNQQCTYCYYKEWNNKGAVEPIENISKILGQLKEIGIQSIEFNGGGEPLMAKDVTDIFVLAHKMGFKLGLITNGVFFTQQIAETFLKLGNYVRFSIDTTDPELYEQIRGTKDLYIVLKNLKEAVEIKDSNKYKCDISAKIGISEQIDIKRVTEVVEYFDGFGLSNLQVKNLWNDAGEHYRKDITRDNLMRLRPRTPLVKKVIYPKFMKEQCWITPIQITVDVFGDVYLCQYNMHRREDHKLCNLFSEPISVVWGSQKHKDKIRNIKISECLKHDCRFQKYQRVMRKL